MKILVAYGTRHGTTQGCADKLKEQIQADVELLKLERGVRRDLSSYDLVIIGSPVYGGSFLKEVKLFMRSHAADLSQKPVGLYMCCITPVREAEKYLRNLFPEDLLSRACAVGTFGGAFKLRDLKPIERFMIRKFKGVREDVSTVSEEQISLFARAVQEACPRQ